MKKSILVMLIAMMMIGLEIVSPLVGTIQAIDRTDDVGSIFTLDYFKANGVEVANNDIILVDADTTIELRYLWELQADHGLLDGDWVEIDIPLAFSSPVPISGELNVTDPVQGSVHVGVYAFDGSTNKLRFTFNSNIENRIVQEGYVGMNLEFDLTYFDENVRQVIPFNDSVDKSLTITLVPSTVSDSISKNGIPDSLVDAQYIDWSIDVLNTEQTAIADGVLVDSIPEGLVLDESSLVLETLVMGYHGDVSVGEMLALDPSQISVENQTLTIDMDVLNAYQGYRLSYQTTFNDLVKLSFTNRAVFSHSGNTDIEAAATVSNLVRSAWIEKSGTKINNNSIRWTIDVNKAGNVLSNASVSDVLDPTITVSNSNVVIHRIALKNGVWVTVGDPVFIDQTSFPIQLGTLSATDAYRIEYTTEFDYNGDYVQTNTLTNEASLLDEGVVVGTDNAEVTIKRDPILSKTGKSNVSYDDKTIDWTVTINKAKHDLGTVSFSDVLPAGLTLLGDTVKIYNESNVEQPAGSFPIRYEGNNLEVDFPNLGKDTYVIKYTTTITDFTVGKTFINKASIRGEGIVGTVEVNSNTKPRDNSFTKSFTAVDYANKTMSWKLVVDPIKENITSLSIKDTFSNAGLIVLEEGFKVTKGGTELVRGVDYTLTPVNGNYNEGFDLVLLANSLPLDAKLDVVYSTSFDPDLGVIENTSLNREYINKADFTYTTPTYTESQTVSKTAKHTLRVDAWNTGKKVGRRVYETDSGLSAGWISGAERLIKWEVYTNFLQQELGTGVTLSDTLGYEGTIILDTVRLFKYTVGTDGSTTITNETFPFTPTLSEDKKTITISFDENVEYNDRYVLSFLTTVPDVSKTSYSNDARVTLADERSFPYTASVAYDDANEFLNKSEVIHREGSNAYIDEEIQWEVTVNESLSIIDNAIIKDTMSVGLVLIEDSIQVYRLVNGVRVVVDAVHYSTNITNNSVDADIPTQMTVTFNSDYVMDATHTIVYKTVVVVDQGSISNSASFAGDLVEEVVVSTPQLTARSLSYAGGISSPSRASIRVVKVDSQSKQPMDSQFELYYMLNGEKKVVEDASFITVDGEYTFDNLSYRTYYLGEISSPTGYTRLKEPIEIVLSPETVGQTRVLEVVVENVQTLTLEKEASLEEDKEFYHYVNELINYTVTAKNTGVETLTNVKITDDKEGLFNIHYKVVDEIGIVSDDVVNGSVTLLPGQSLVMTSQYRITQEDADLQVVHNDASVVGYDENNEELSATDETEVEGKYQPEITIEKYADVMVNDTQSKVSVNQDNVVETVGEWIAYSVIATNTGNITLHQVMINDDKANLVDIRFYKLDANDEVIGEAINGETTLKSNEKLMMNAMYQVTQADIDQGDIHNLASVIGYPEDPDNPGQPNEDDPVEDETTKEVPTKQVGAISLDKSSSDIETENSLGSVIDYSFVVINTGNTTLRDVYISDDLVDNLEYVSLNGVAIATEDTTFVLRSGDVLIAKASYVVTQADIDRGYVLNHATTTGTDINEEPVNDEDEEQTPLTQVNKITVDKTSIIVGSDEQVKEHFTSLDDVVEYTIVVENQGNTSLNNVVITESMIDELENITYTLLDAQGEVKAELTHEQFVNVVLLPKEKIVMRATYAITQKDLDKGKVMNAVSVHGEDEDGEVLGDDEDNDEADGLFSLIIQKVDDQDQSVVLEGAIFELTDQTNETTWTLTTDALGQASVNGLVAGTYTLREVTAPEGYQINDETIEVILGADGSVITLVITNEKKIMLPDTSDTGMLTWGALLLMSVGGLLILLSRKRKQVNH